jgi:voltage-gated potassium channel
MSVGTVGYMVLEHWTAIDSLYMTVITLSTVGFREVRDLSPQGRLFTTGLIVSSVGVVAYLFGAISQYIVSGELHGSLRRKRMQKSINTLKHHYIVCGYGRVGRQVVESLRAAGRTSVVIDPDQSEETYVDGALFVQGDAADDDVLTRAGLENAAGLVAATGDDPTNLFITVSARAMRPDLVIVARANLPATQGKLLRGGASHVLSPYTIGGRRIATQILYPGVADFLDVVMHSGDLELCLEECMVWPGSSLQGKTIAEAQVRQATGANVLAVRRSDGGTMVTNPPGDMRFEPGDVLIALGTRDQLRALVTVTNLEP